MLFESSLLFSSGCLCSSGLVCGTGGMMVDQIRGRDLEGDFVSICSILRTSLVYYEELKWSLLY